MRAVAIALIFGIAAGAGYGLTMPSVATSELLSNCQNEADARRLAAMPSVPLRGEAPIDL